MIYNEIYTWIMYEDEQNGRHLEEVDLYRFFDTWNQFFKKKNEWITITVESIEHADIFSKYDHSMFWNTLSTLSSELKKIASKTRFSLWGTNTL